MARDPFEEHENVVDLRHIVEGCDEMHLRRTGIREAGFDSTVDERSDQGLCAIQFGHRLFSVVGSEALEASSLEPVDRVRRITMTLAVMDRDPGDREF